MILENIITPTFIPFSSNLEIILLIIFIVLLYIDVDCSVKSSKRHAIILFLFNLSVVGCVCVDLSIFYNNNHS